VFKIAYIVNILGNPGGMERVLSTKVNYFCTELNYEVTIIVKHDLPNDLFFNFSNNVKIVSLNLKKEVFGRIFPKR
jgi:hypothetical protein